MQVGKMKKLSIRADDILFAWQDDLPDNLYYLDTESGDTRLVNRNLEDLRDLTDEIEGGIERFLYIPKPDKNLLIDDLKEFKFTVEDQSLQSILDIAFESPDVVGSFKKILEKNPDEKRRLDQFIKSSLIARIERWLKSNSIEPQFL